MQEFRTAITCALKPNTFINYNQGWNFVRDLDSIRATITGLIDQGDPSSAAQLLEFFIVACHKKAYEVDDSSNNLGMFVEDLFSDWIKARQATNADADETVSRLFDWMDVDDHAYTNCFDRVAVKALDELGLEAFARATRSRLAGHSPDSFAARELVKILKAIYIQQGDIDAYVELCQAEGTLTPKDCETIAEFYQRGNHLQEALDWVEHGLQIQGDGQSFRMNEYAWGLDRLHREILLSLGRREEALAVSWDVYVQSPSTINYKDLMRCIPPGDRPEWHQRAMDSLSNASLYSKVDILTETKEWGRLAAVIQHVSRKDLMALSYRVTEPAAVGLAEQYPLAAARIRTALALDILESKKSRLYRKALRHLEFARDLLLQENKTDDWIRLVDEIRRDHGRKWAFMPKFELLSMIHEDN